jgi:hypothetical protein
LDWPRVPIRYMDNASLMRGCAMNAIRVQTTVRGETLRLPQLKRFKGKRVDIVVTEAESKAAGKGHARNVRQRRDILKPDPVLSDPKLWEGFEDWLEKTRSESVIRELP